jgi:hypothetical protein
LSALAIFTLVVGVGGYLAFIPWFARREYDPEWKGLFFDSKAGTICIAALLGLFWPLAVAYWLIDKLIVPLVFRGKGDPNA